MNNRYEEVYIPDWIIHQNNRKFIIEYFGLYNFKRYKTYKEKADRKIEFFQSLKDYEFIAIMPNDFREHVFDKIASLLANKGIFLNI
jgi:predicted nuclease of restriction endonuclease-like RecB superfamily